MFPRQMAKTIEMLRKTMPIVTILGPRQSGKTTLAETEESNESKTNFLPPISGAENLPPSGTSSSNRGLNGLHREKGPLHRSDWQQPCR